MKPLSAHLLASVIGLAVGLLIAWFIWFWPYVVGADDFMVVWGWIGWLPAMFVGYVGAGIAHRIALRALDVSTGAGR